MFPGMSETREEDVTIRFVIPVVMWVQISVVKCLNFAVGAFNHFNKTFSSGNAGTID